MNNFLRVGLPIIVVFVVVFVITLAQRYTTDTDETPIGDPNAKSKPLKAREVPLRFFTTQAVSGLTAPADAKAHLKYWNPSVEIGQHGSLEFLCENRNPQPVTINVPRASCQCVGTHLGIIPHEAWRTYTQTSVLANGPWAFASPLAAVVNHVQFNKAIKWDTLKAATENSKETIDNTLSIPAADPKYGPQMAFFRLGWTGKSPAEPKEISADVHTSLPGALLSSTQIQAKITTVTPFAVFRRDPAAGFALSNEILVEDIRANESVSRDIFFLSATRSYPIYSVALQNGPNPCITISDPQAASDEERKSFEAFLASDPKISRAIQSLYKVTVTVRERVETMAEGKKTTHQLDLGLLEQRLTVSALTDAAEPAQYIMVLKGRVYGELTVAAGAETGRIELGNSFPANEDRSKDVTVVAEQPGLDVILVKEETSPAYLQTSIEPLPPVDGRKRWRVRVTVPKGKLFGALPLNSGIVLMTTDANPRRIRIPVRGMSADTGGSRPDL